ncbi:MAG: hypothetical protein WAS27_02505 [Candidatus Saccharimonadales bacterium]
MSNLAYTEVEHVIITDDTHPIVALELDPSKPHGDPVEIDKSLSKVIGVARVDVDHTIITITLSEGVSWAEDLEQYTKMVLSRTLDREIIFQTQWAMVV